MEARAGRQERGQIESRTNSLHGEESPREFSCAVTHGQVFCAWMSRGITIPQPFIIIIINSTRNKHPSEHFFPPSLLVVPNESYDWLSPAGTKK